MKSRAGVSLRNGYAHGRLEGSFENGSDGNKSCTHHRWPKHWDHLRCRMLKGWLVSRDKVPDMSE